MKYRQNALFSHQFHPNSSQNSLKSSQFHSKRVQIACKRAVLPPKWAYLVEFRSYSSYFPNSLKFTNSCKLVNQLELSWIRWNQVESQESQGIPCNPSLMPTNPSHFTKFPEGYRDRAPKPYPLYPYLLTLQLPRTRAPTCAICPMRARNNGQAKPDLLGGPTGPPNPPGVQSCK